MTSGMRPLFKTVKAHEATTVRPFENEHISARGFCRIRQWGPIWQITAEPVDPPEFLRQLAVEQASILKPISPLQVARYFKVHATEGPWGRRLEHRNAQTAQLGRVPDDGTTPS